MTRSEWVLWRALLAPHFAALWLIRHSFLVMACAPQLAAYDEWWEAHEPQRRRIWFSC